MIFDRIKEFLDFFDGLVIGGNFKISLNSNAEYAFLTFVLVSIVSFIIVGIVLLVVPLLSMVISTIPIPFISADVPPPEADLTTNSPNYERNVGEGVLLDARSSVTDSAGLRYKFDVNGDGTVDYQTSRGSVFHKYDEPGNYTASVTVVDTHNQNDTANVTVRVNEQPRVNDYTVDFEDGDINVSIVASEELSAFEVTQVGPSGETTVWDRSDFDSVALTNETYQYQTEISEYANGDHEFVLSYIQDMYGEDAQSTVPVRDMVRADDGPPELTNGVMESSTEFVITVEDPIGVVSDGINTDTFETNVGEISDINIRAESTNVIVEGTLKEPLDTDNITVSIAPDQYIEDKQGNRLTSTDVNRNSVTITGVDSVAPRIESAALIDETTVEVMIREDGSGIDRSALVLASPEIVGSDVGFVSDVSQVNDSQVTPIKYRLNLDESLNESMSEDKEISLVMDQLKDKAGNTNRNIETVINRSANNATIESPTSLQVTNAEAITKESIVVTIEDSENGIDMSSIRSNTFAISPGNIGSISTLNTETQNETITKAEIQLNLADFVDSDEIEILLAGSISNNEGDKLSTLPNNLTVSGMDGVAPQIEDAEQVGSKSIELTLVDEGTGIDESSIVANSFNVRDNEIISIDKSSLSASKPPHLTLVLNDSIFDTDVTVESTRTGFTDMAGNVQNSDEISFAADKETANVTNFQINSIYDQYVNLRLETDKEVDNFTISTNDSKDALDITDFDETEPTVYETNYTVKSTDSILFVIEDIVLDEEPTEQVTTEIFNVNSSWRSSGGSEDLSRYTDIDGPTTDLQSDWLTRDVSEPVKSTPVVEGMVVAASQNGSVTALHATNGSGKWQTTGNSNIETAPMVMNGTVVQPRTDGSVELYDLRSGDMESSFTTDKQGLRSPNTDYTDTIFVGSNSAAVIAYDMNGDMEWQWDSVGAADVESQLAVQDDEIIAAFSNNSVGSINKSSGKLNWVYNDISSDIVGLSTYNSQIVVSTDDRMITLAENGEESWTVSSDAQITEPSISMNGIAVGVGDELRYYGTNGQLEWSSTVNGYINIAPTQSRDAVYVAYNDVVKGYEVDNGNEIVSNVAQDTVNLEPAIYDGRIVSGSDSAIFSFRE